MIGRRKLSLGCQEILLKMRLFKLDLQAPIGSFFLSDSTSMKLNLKELELRQYKNNSIQSKENSNFEIAALFHRLYGEGKNAAISKLNSF